MRLVRKAAVLLIVGVVGTVCAQEMPREAQPCVACHGEHGLGTAKGPMLAGLSKEYIYAQIGHFISGRRSNIQMTPMAQGYTDPQLREPVAAYFAAQGKQPQLQLRGQRQPKSLAEQLYYQGDPTRDIPACFSCHGPAAVGGGPFPRLAGQQADYLGAQLVAWQKGERSGDPDNMMGTIANRLSGKDIQALASYLSSIR
ncbi:MULTISPECIES: c-type cytochrome [Pseudomonas]|uniref:c-type cytochrome n=1 Tax=Pseudomonas TaxID=286 RepID=UPI000D00219D|nr:MULTISPECIES: c-type cytochrome [Pseudomonas]PRA51989.1 cytochrome c [Pseudomonas sp. MYb115]QXN51352.1 c-type cytochrome [Pseudomonas fluorescens]WSO25670.1 c-type cytochrome [Pseudomonas fluorescens]